MVNPSWSRRRPLRSELRRRMMARSGLTMPDLPTHSVRVGGLDRTYSIVPGPTRDAPLLLVLHGAGSTGLGMAALTDLHARGPTAGYAVAFPDGWGRVLVRPAGC